MLRGEIRGGLGLLAAGRKRGESRLYSYLLPDDENTAQRIFSDLGAHERVDKGHVRGLFVLGPFLEVLGDEDDVILAPVEIGDVRFVSAFAQVLSQGFDDGFLVVNEASPRISALSYQYLGSPDLNPRRATHPQ